MKAKLKIHVEVIPSQTIPGKFNLATQYTDGGAITTNDNNGQGFTEEEATEEARKIRSEATPSQKPEATLERTQREVGTGNGYRWTEGYHVITPDGKKLFPPVSLNEARQICKREGWTLKR